jgi:phosphoribosylformimino-5-aminoimidazole carboxamide ribonucleotide (ProFAR) isomerase
MVAEHGPAAVAVAIDVRDQQAVGHGWLRDAPGADPVQSITTLAAIGVRTFEVTAIDRDGSLEGPDVAGLQRVVALGAGEVIASGGIRSLADLEAVRDIGCRGAIVGRALYEGGLDLAAAIALFQAPTEPSPTTSCQ